MVPCYNLSVHTRVIGKSENLFQDIRVPLDRDDGPLKKSKSAGPLERDLFILRRVQALEIGLPMPFLVDTQDLFSFLFEDTDNLSFGFSFPPKLLYEHINNISKMSSPYVPGMDINVLSQFLIGPDKPESQLARNKCPPNSV